MKWRDRLIALGITVVVTAVVSAAGGSEGFTRDEGYYFDAAEMYYAWYGEVGEAIADGKPGRALNRNSIDRWFNYNHEHPALMKTLYGFSWRFLHKCTCQRHAGRHPVGYPKQHRTLGLFSDARALRFPAALFAGLLSAIAYLFGTRAFSRRAGIVAAVLSIAAPRIFFNAELSCFDAPVATTWLATCYAWWRSLDEPKWAWRTGAAFGLSLAAKLNGFFIPFVLLAHYLWVHRATLRRFKLPPIPAAFVWMATLGPAIWFAHWPWMWFDTLHYHAGRFTGRLPEYLEFHLHHVYYNMEYLGANYNKPPFPKAYPFVMTLFTAPVTTLALALAGAVALLRPAREAEEEPPRENAVVGMAVRPEPVERPRFRRPAAGLSTAPGALVAMNALFPMAIIAFTGAPIFGATKHWLAAIPFIAILAGVGVDRLLAQLVAHLRLDGARAAAAGAAAVALACAPAIAETWRSHPYGLTHYNLLAGGPAGGADLGMNRQFWGYSTRGILPWLNEHAHKNPQIYWHDTNQPILNMNVREGLMRDDFGNTGLEEPGVKASSIAMVIHEKHFDKYEYWIWDFYGTSRPSLVLTHEGVPIVTVYERPK